MFKVLRDWRSMRYLRQGWAKRVGRGLSQLSHSAQRDWRYILAATMVGASNPSGSNTRAVSERTIRLVSEEEEFAGWLIVYWKQSKLGFHNSPSVLIDSCEWISKGQWISRWFSGTYCKRSLFLDAYLHNVKPPDCKRFMSCFSSSQHVIRSST